MTPPTSMLRRQISNRRRYLPDHLKVSAGETAVCHSYIALVVFFRRGGTVGTDSLMELTGGVRDSSTLGDPPYETGADAGAPHRAD